MTKETPEPGNDTGLPDDRAGAFPKVGSAPIFKLNPGALANDNPNFYETVARRMADGSTGEGDQ